MRSKKRQRSWLLRAGLPEDVLGRGARVTWFARSCVLVEGQQGVVELSLKRIRLQTQCGVLSVSGEELVLYELSADAAMIKAQSIDTLTYLRAEAGMERSDWESERRAGRRCT